MRRVQEETSMSSLPLAGITICELGHSVAAPFAAQVLGDLGASVMKVEKPAGDDARRWGPPFWEGESAIFQTLNRNKGSAALDLRDATLVPMAEVPDRLDALPAGRDIVVVCHHGVRSRHVAARLERAGHRCVWNLDGGVDAWARDVDASMPTY